MSSSTNSVECEDGCSSSRCDNSNHRKTGCWYRGEGSGPVELGHFISVQESEGCEQSNGNSGNSVQVSVSSFSGYSDSVPQGEIITKDSDVIEESSSQNSRCIGNNSECGMGGRYEISSNIFKCFAESIDKNKRWIGDIYTHVRTSYLERLVQDATTYSLCIGRAFAIIFHSETEETGHLHLYHSCQFTNSHCRCAWYKRIILGLNNGNREGRLKHRHGRRPVYCQEAKGLYWRKFLQYFSQTRRQIIFLAINGKTYSKDACRFTHLRRCRCCEEREGSEESMEVSILQGEDCTSRAIHEEGEASTHSQDGKGAEEPHCSTSQGVSTGKIRNEPIPKKLKSKLNDHNYILKFMKEFLCVPISAVSDTPEWLAHEIYNVYDRKDPDFRRAVNLFERQFKWTPFFELINIALTVKYLYYQAKYIDYYYSVKESVAYVEQLLDFQYGLQFPYFLRRLFDILEMRLKKTNAMFIVGEPSSGKTWFFDMITSFYVNVGFVGNFNKNHSFPLNGCYGKRVLMWNEPNIELSAFDTVKMLCAGDNCDANIKYSDNVEIARTPLIFTSNKNIFNQNDPIWRERIIFEPKWSAAPFLFNFKKYPHPLCYPVLIHKYLMSNDQTLTNYVSTILSKY